MPRDLTRQELADENVRVILALIDTYEKRATQEWALKEVGAHEAAIRLHQEQIADIYAKHEAAPAELVKLRKRLTDARQTAKVTVKTNAKKAEKLADLLEKVATLRAELAKAELAPDATDAE